MLKEIYEQPAVIGDTISSYLNPATLRDHAARLPVRSRQGAALHDLGLRHRLLCRLRRQILVRAGGARAGRASISPRSSATATRRCPRAASCIVVSQSGETVDTLAALRYAKEQRQNVIAVVNVPESSIAREADVVLPTQAGPEIGVASTKAFTTQLTVLAASRDRHGAGARRHRQEARGASVARHRRSAGARRRGLGARQAD